MMRYTYRLTQALAAFRAVREAWSTFESVSPTADASS